MSSPSIRNIRVFSTLIEKSEIDIISAGWMDLENFTDKGLSKYHYESLDFRI